MVTDDVWKAAGMPGDVFCIGCLELRIGLEDFSGVLINELRLGNSINGWPIEITCDPLSPCSGTNLASVAADISRTQFSEDDFRIIVGGDVINSETAAVFATFPPSAVDVWLNAEMVKVFTCYWFATGRFEVISRRPGA